MFSRICLHVLVVVIWLMFSSPRDLKGVYQDMCLKKGWLLLFAEDLWKRERDAGDTKLISFNFFVGTTHFVTRLALKRFVPNIFYQNQFIYVLHEKMDGNTILTKAVCASFYGKDSLRSPHLTPTDLGHGKQFQGSGLTANIEKRRVW